MSLLNLNCLDIQVQHKWKVGGLFSFKYNCGNIGIEGIIFRTVRKVLHGFHVYFTDIERYSRTFHLLKSGSLETRFPHQRIEFKVFIAPPFLLKTTFRNPFMVRFSLKLLHSPDYMQQ